MNSAGGCADNGAGPSVVALTSGDASPAMAATTSTAAGTASAATLRHRVARVGAQCTDGLCTGGRSRVGARVAGAVALILQALRHGRGATALRARAAHSVEADIGHATEGGAGSCSVPSERMCNEIRLEESHALHLMALRCLASACRDPDWVIELGVLGGHKLLLRMSEEAVCCAFTPKPTEEVAELVAAVINACTNAPGLPRHGPRGFPMMSSSASMADIWSPPPPVEFDMSVYVSPEDSALLSKDESMARHGSTDAGDDTTGLPEALSERLKVLIRQSPNRQDGHHATGFTVWPSAYVLARWICSCKIPTLLSTVGPRVIELGAGPGLPSIVAAALGGSRHAPGRCTVVATDYNEETLSNLQACVESNARGDSSGGGIPSVQHLDWNDVDSVHERAYDIILAADVICEDDDAYLVVSVISRLLGEPSARTRGEPAEAWLTCPQARMRYGVDKLQPAASEHGISVSKVELPSLISSAGAGAGGVSGLAIDLFVLRRISDYACAGAATGDRVLFDGIASVNMSRK